MRSNYNQNSRQDRDYQMNSFSRRDRGQKMSQRPEYDQQHEAYSDPEDQSQQYDRGSSFGTQGDRSFTDYMRDDSSHSHTSTPYRQSQDFSSSRPSQDYSSRSSQDYSSSRPSQDYSSRSSQDYSSSRPQFDRTSGKDQMGRKNFGSQSYGSQNYGSQNYNQYGQHDDTYSSSRDASQSYQGRYSGMGPKGYKRSDERIREDVCEALARDSEVDATHIEVEVKEGTVTLSGSVETRQAKRHAEDCIESLSGVKDITNNIRMEKDSSSTAQTNRSSSNQSMMSSTSQSPSSTASTSKKVTQ